MVIYEGPAEGLLEKVADLVGKRVRLEVLEEAPKRAFDPAAHERNLQELAEITAHTHPLPSRSYTAEDFYLPDRFGPFGTPEDE